MWVAKGGRVIAPSGDEGKGKAVIAWITAWVESHKWGTK
ncbi:hypothetical protein ckrop_1510 [Corynebacterium kroppenstedtii DSM 44385]|uniref:Uncharacterized protein n=1 Tax=Corynebacterium kroppenstedtii (strain DSM 44385 / JCM 11950 / CIP 105744 / CCUG 35717) TaxID=645127 RepID=C4LK84_CORK4|nr:hypothetical protein ckrop_1510 [Corynebacterium kroppenstedtii DSM 44385]